jgi:hypothetical protein
MYIVFDEFTKLILGGLANLGKPNSTLAQVALLSCFEDKVEMCRGKGIFLSDNDWPKADMLPFHICGDFVRANYMLSMNLRTVMSVPSLRPQHHPNIEKHFSDLERSLNPNSASPDEREQARGPETTAKLSSKDIDRILALKVAKHNRRIPRDQYVGLAEHLYGGKRSYKHLGGGTEAPLAEALRSHLLPRVKTARRTRVGLQVSTKDVQNLYYLPSLSALVGARPNLSNKPQVYYDPRSVDTVWLHVGSERPPAPCSLSPLYRKYAGMSWAEVGLLQQQRRDRQSARNRADDNHRPEAKD